MSIEERARLAILLATLALVLVAAPVAGQSPVPIATPFDPRADGEGPGVVGAPLLAALVVIGLGVLTCLATIVAVRLGHSRR